MPSALWIAHVTVTDEAAYSKYAAIATEAIAEFGGVKGSGYGRESGFQAIYDYTRPKTVWMNTSDEPLGSQFVAR